MLAKNSGLLILALLPFMYGCSEDSASPDSHKLDLLVNLAKSMLDNFWYLFVFAIVIAFLMGLLGVFFGAGIGRVCRYSSCYYPSGSWFCNCPVGSYRGIY